MTKQLGKKYKNEPYWTFSNELKETLVAESRGLTPEQWRETSTEDKIEMIATYEVKQEMKNFERFYYEQQVKND